MPTEGHTKIDQPDRQRKALFVEQLDVEDRYAGAIVIYRREDLVDRGYRTDRYGGLDQHGQITGENAIILDNEHSVRRRKLSIKTSLHLFIN